MTKQNGRALTGGNRTRAQGETHAAKHDISKITTTNKTFQPPGTAAIYGLKEYRPRVAEAFRLDLNNLQMAKALEAVDHLLVLAGRSL